MDFGTTKMIARKEGGIGWMIFNQPEKHNAVSLEMWVGDAEDHRRLRGGPGGARDRAGAAPASKAFVSGADISEFEEKRGSEEADPRLRRASAMRRTRRSPRAASPPSP